MVINDVFIENIFSYIKLFRTEQVKLTEKGGKCQRNINRGVSLFLFAFIVPLNVPMERNGYQGL